MIKRAFTLIELSVIITVIAVLAAGAIVLSTAKVKTSKEEITRKRIEVVYKALVEYVMKNYALPCPASLTEEKYSIDYGQEVGGNGSCTTFMDNEGIYAASQQTEVIYGAVPFREIGLDDEYGEDGYGSKLVYVVAQDYTKMEFPTMVNNGGFSFKDEGAPDAIKVKRVSASNVTLDVMFVIMSLGENRAGAYSAASSLTQNSATSSNSYEQENYLTNINTAASPDSADFGADISYPSEVVLNYDDISDPTFDDILFFKTRDDFLRDYPQAMFLAGCDSSDTGWASGYDIAYYGGVDYNSSSCPFPDTSNYAAKTCGFLGKNWYDIVSCP